MMSLTDEERVTIALFVAHKVADEREACAQIALAYRDEADSGQHPDMSDPAHSLGQGYAANRIAKRILARGKSSEPIIIP